MNEKTYHRMTKKPLFRRFKLFKQKYFTKQRLYALLAKIRLVREVKKITTKPYRDCDLLGKIKVSDSPIYADRGTFNLSYRAEAMLEEDLWYYESLFARKRLYTVKEDSIYRVAIGVRSECLSFWVKPDPFNQYWVERERPHIHTFIRGTDSPLEGGVHQVKEIKCNFFDARLGSVLHHVVYSEEEIENAISALAERAREGVINYIEKKPEEINEKLCGVKHDGALQTADGHTLIQNCICHRCGRPVFTTSTNGYFAQCVSCDEDLYQIEVDRLDPVKYEDILEFNKKLLYDLLTRQ